MIEKTVDLYRQRNNTYEDFDRGKIFESLIDDTKSSLTKASSKASETVIENTKEQLMRRAYEEKMKMILDSRGNSAKSAVELAKEIKF